MGDIGGGDANGVVMEERSVYMNPDPSSISQDYWVVAEETAQEVVNAIHPTMDSEEKRKDVIDYLQRLIRFSLGFEVFPYGSVPLKTYLPDGDIDLTIFSSPYAEESWAKDVLSVLQREEQNEDAEYEVKDTHFIDAEVKLVKCLVQNIVIDISFNQLGGLCTLCFLEQVDRLVGRYHLFKRSIILIKAWCYYESRILGAHHGLISTYALETLVLYIFHLFHSSLCGPLAVLYKFLDYFSKFDWENYCISLNGPVCKSSLPEIVVQMPQNEGNEMMLSEEFLRNCVEMFSVPSRGGLESNSRVFLPKHLNIIDPLKEYNNLGRSVHRGNFYRIRSAFKYGARKLGRILSLPKDEIADEVKNFFGNTLQRHAFNCGSDIQDFSLRFGGEGCSTLYSYSSAVVSSEDHMLLRSSTGDSEYDSLLMEGKSPSVQLDRCSMKVVSLKTMSESSCSVDGTPVSRYHLNGNPCDLATHCSLDLRTSNATSECSPTSNCSGSFFGRYCHIPQFYLSKSYVENGHSNQTDPFDGVEEKLGLDSWLEQREDHLEKVGTFESYADSLDGFCSCCSAVSSPKTNILDNLSLDFREMDSGSVVDAEPLNPLADLSGDYDSHIRSLLYGQGWNGLSALVLPNPPVLPSRFQNKKPWDTVRQSMPLMQSSFSQMSISTLSMGSPSSSHAPSVSTFTCEEKHKARGTGTYLPVMNSSSRDRPSQGRGRSKAPVTHGQSERHPRGNGFIPAFSETNYLAKGGCELFHGGCPVQAHKKCGVSCQSHPSQDGDTRANGFSNSSRRIQFGSLGQLVDDVISASGYACGLTSSDQMNAKSDSIKEERVAVQSFGLKNEDEFPPLSL